MMTKLKLALVTSIGLLGTVGGIAAANNIGGNDAATPDRSAMKAEWQAKRAERKAQMLAKYDTNKDGKLDANERAVMKQEIADKRFAKLDANGDGVISKAEFEAGAARLGGHHRHFRGGQKAPGQE